MELTPILTIAAKEFRDRMRNRWVLAVALVFTVFSLAIAYLGGAQQGAVGLRSAEATIASLVSLVIYLIPLIALLLGFDSIVGERERGSLDLLLALPITRLEGKRKMSQNRNEADRAGVVAGPARARLSGGVASTVTQPLPST